MSNPKNEKPAALKEPPANTERLTEEERLLIEIGKATVDVEVANSNANSYRAEYERLKPGQLGLINKLGDLQSKNAPAASSD